RSGTASCSGYGFSPTAARALVMFFPAFLICLLRLPPLNAVSKSRGVFDFGRWPPASSYCWTVARPRPTGRARRPSLRTLNDINSHRPRRALHAIDGCFEGRRIQIAHLLLRDVF